ncbi:hypothetical protein B0T25DRAFT_543255 [Lasiosphaeria hispida]|uniref:Uncharacterized protein n=1 Tax=Lasiosphaeria hispida TaxID=260671 RepID=A0AAJ0HI99_9PEZI|nr:hypothetical protein B0T25DRAFT_543255 [Lasiosphaeria hispida]
MSKSYPYGYEMAATYDSGLEAAPQNFPEVSHPQPQGSGDYGFQQHSGYQQQTAYQQQGSYPQQPYHQHAYSDTPIPKPEPSPDAPYTPGAPSTYGGQTVASPYAAAAHIVPPPQSKSSGKTVCGCSLLVFILSCIIALLSAAVIGLAAGTGIEAQRANDATTQFIALNASFAATPTAVTTSSTPTATALPIDDGCAEDPEGVNGTVYQSFSLLGGLKFTRYCNRDAKYAPLFSLFTSSFSTCMDACAAYTKYVPTYYGNNANSTCAAVSFIPAWTGKVNATNGGAPGNCYLKPGPQNGTSLAVPNIGVDCHAGVYTPGA